MWAPGDTSWRLHAGVLPERQNKPFWASYPGQRRCGLLTALSREDGTVQVVISHISSRFLGANYLSCRSFVFFNLLPFWASIVLWSLPHSGNSKKKKKSVARNGDEFLNYAEAADLTMAGSLCLPPCWTLILCECAYGNFLWEGCLYFTFLSDLNSLFPRIEGKWKEPASTSPAAVRSDIVGLPRLFGGACSKEV